MNDLKEKIQASVNLYKSGNFIKCEETTKILIEQNPKVVFLYNLMGLALTALKRNDEAAKVYNKGIKIDPNFSMIYNNLGSIYRLKKNNKKAEDYFKKSINLDSNISEPHNNLGNLYKKK